jgi:hypothetical protein
MPFKKLPQLLKRRAISMSGGVDALQMTVIRLVQLPNASLPIKVRLAGSVILVRLLQYWKAVTSMELTTGTFMLVRLSQ